MTESRRDFLASAALTASVVGQSLAKEALAGDDSDPVRVAVIGTGARGCDLIRALTTIPAARVVALCDPYGPHRERGWQYAGPLARTYDDARRMLEEVRPDATVIAVPLAEHFAMCRLALEAGGGVFCEKMLCYSLDQARELAARVTARKSVFQVGLQRRSNAIYRQAAAMVQTGMLGRITAIECQWHRHHNWRRPVPVLRESPDFAGLDRQLNWRLYRATSQGLMAELGSHQMDVVNWLLGTHPRRVLASGGLDYWRDGREVRDNMFCVYDYQVTPRPAGRGQAEVPGTDRDSYTVRVTYSTLQNNAHEGASELILGTRGSLFLTQKKGLFYRELTPDSQEASLRPDRQAAAVTSGKTLKLANDPWAHRGAPFEIDSESDDTRDHLVSFLDHVRAGEPQTACPVGEGLINTATILMANESADLGRPVDWPL